MEIRAIKQKKKLKIFGKKFIKKNKVFEEKTKIKRSKTNQIHTKKAYDYYWKDKSFLKNVHLKYIKNSTYKEFPKMSKYINQIKKNSNIVELGCGVGGSSLATLEKKFQSSNYFGFDISSGIYLAQKRFEKKSISSVFFKTDLNELKPNKFADLVISFGVIQHTGDIPKAVEIISKCLKKDGYAIFNAYKKAPPIRYFSDNFIHDQIKKMKPNDALKELKSLTKFGISLAKSGIRVKVRENLDFLGIKRGNYNLQTFFFDYIFKTYVHENETFGRLLHLNSDWYYPENRNQISPKEFYKVIKKNNMKIMEKNITGTFISVICKKK